jgi:hypothetical protein
MNWYKLSQNITFYDDVDDISITGRKTYIRFGDLPKNNSFNWRNMETEGGVSVYVAIKGKEGKYIIPDMNDASGLDSFWGGSRPAYEVSGNEIGEGADGEPLLDKKGIKIICNIDISKIFYSEFSNISIKEFGFIPET